MYVSSNDLKRKKVNYALLNDFNSTKTAFCVLIQCFSGLAQLTEY